MMETTEKKSITVRATINSPVETVWEYWTVPEYITRWCAASDDWHAPYAENDLRINGKFKTTMAAKDGSASFDFEGLYEAVEPYKKIDYVLSDGRKVRVTFEQRASNTEVIETSEAENENPLEMQRAGWQAILNKFKALVENR